MRASVTGGDIGRAPGAWLLPQAARRAFLLPRGGFVNLLGEIAAAADPALRAHGLPNPGPGRFERSSVEPLRRFVLEAIYEAYLAHYATPRAFEPMDSDLTLLAGDSLYALGLERLADAGDLDA